MSNVRRWTKAQTSAAVAGYVELERRAAAGEPLEPEAVAKALSRGPCAPREPPAVLHRLGQIAGVAERQGGRAVEGVRTKRALTREGLAWIVAALEALAEHRPPAHIVEVAPTEDAEEFWERTEALLGPAGERVLRYVPARRGRPEAVLVTAAAFRCDPAVTAWALKRAGGLCEGCGEVPPFVDSSGVPYLQPTHLLPLEYCGRDDPSNVAALCPTCAARLRHSADRLQFRRDVGHAVGLSVLEHFGSERRDVAGLPVMDALTLRPLRTIPAEP